MIKYWEDWLKKKGVKKVRLSTYLKENKSFYESLGFELNETKEKEVGTKYIMIKNLV